MRISMWGPKSAGKTTYIAMVYGTALKSNTQWVIRPNDINSTNFVRDNINRIRSGGFPEPTFLVEEPNMYQYQIRTKIAQKEDENSNPAEEKEFLNR